MQIRLHSEVEALLGSAVDKANKRKATIKEKHLGYRATTITQCANEILFQALREGKLRLDWAGL